MDLAWVSLYLASSRPFSLWVSFLDLTLWGKVVKGVLSLELNSCLERRWVPQKRVCLCVYGYVCRWNSLFATAGSCTLCAFPSHTQIHCSSHQTMTNGLWKSRGFGQKAGPFDKEKRKCVGSKCEGESGFHSWTISWESLSRTLFWKRKCPYPD